MFYPAIVSPIVDHFTQRAKDHSKEITRANGREFAICHVVRHGNVSGRLQMASIVGLVTGCRGILNGIHVAVVYMINRKLTTNNMNGN